MAYGGCTENRKITILRNCTGDFDEIVHDDTLVPQSIPTRCQFLKIHGRHFEKEH